MAISCRISPSENWWDADPRCPREPARGSYIQRSPARCPVECASLRRFGSPRPGPLRSAWPDRNPGPYPPVAREHDVFGFRTRCVIPDAWAHASPSASCTAISSKRFLGTGPRMIRSKTLTLNQFADQIGLAIMLADVVYSNDVGMSVTCSPRELRTQNGRGDPWSQVTRHAAP